MLWAASEAEGLVGFLGIIARAQLGVQGRFRLVHLESHVVDTSAWVCAGTVLTTFRQTSVKKLSQCQCVITRTCKGLENVDDDEHFETPHNLFRFTIA